MIYFRPRDSFSANFCPIFIAFLQPEIVSNRSIATKVNRLEPTNPLEVFALPKFWFVSSVDSLLTIGDRHWQKLGTTFESRISNSLPFAR